MPTASPDQLEFFEREVRPLLAEHCYACHSGQAEKLQAGLYVDSRKSLLTGGDSGAAIVPGDIDASLLIESVRYEGYEMPPAGKLASQDIAVFEKWISMGAPWPAGDAAASNTPRDVFDLEQRKQDHWAWQPITAPEPPQVANAAWPQDALDQFILAELEDAGFEPAADASPQALMRRLYFDIIGLPPTPEQFREFMSDTRPDRVERLVDKLLKSPHFGERWGRHWLDLVRYAESRGHEFDNDSRNAYQYRDYIIRALNDDVPYDQLVREHIAGDLLEQPRLNPAEGFNESILGTGFWFLGEWVHSPVDIRKDESDRFDNMIDVMSKTFLGVTVACARCHDHKFDAISTADYYSLAGFLQSSDYRQVRFESLEHNRRIASQLAELDASFQTRLEKLFESELGPLEQPSGPPDSLAENIVVDYHRLTGDAFLQDGFIFGNSPQSIGEIYLDASQEEPQLAVRESSAAVSDPFWDGLRSIDEQGINQRSRLAGLPRSGRTLRTPTFVLNDGKVACRARGTGHVVACVDSHRLVAGPLHGETIQAIKPDVGWVTLKLDRYVGHGMHLEFTPAEGQQLEVSLVVQAASGEVKRACENLESARSQTAEQRQEQLQAALASDSSTAEKAHKLLDAWSTARTELRQQVRLESRLAMAMLDGTSEDDRLLIRGSSSNPGELVPRHFLTAIASDQPMPITRGSGRLELANQINAADNPLTSRVIANRIWHLLLGRGIVPTTDDFGVLGMRPTHPELLDYLATRFVAEGQSIKGMIRKIVLSRTYQISSQASPAALAADPKNLLWHYRSPKRLEGEAIRDALLLLSGQMDAQPFGEPIPIHLTPFMDGRGRPAKSGPLDGGRRRSIYTAVRRNFLSPFMVTFDSPTPFSTMGRRNVSNVPAQALIMMNDPLVQSLTQGWAARACSGGDAASPDFVTDRVSWLFESAFARTASEPELQAAVAFVRHRASELDVPLSDAAAWEELTHALANTKEFIFVR